MISQRTTAFKEKSSPVPTEFLSALFLCLLLFSIPINNGAKSISLVLSLTFILLHQPFQLKLIQSLKEPWVQAIGLFFGFSLLACLWSPADWSDQGYVLQKYMKLLMLPILVLGFQKPTVRHFGLHAFLAAMTFTCLMAWLKPYFPHYLHHEEPGSVFRNYIMTGHMMAFACFVSANFAITTPKHRFIYLALCALFSYQILFLSMGRTGYILYFLLVLLFLVFHVNKKHLLRAALLFLACSFLALSTSTQMQKGFQQIQANLKGYQTGDKNTSIGYRLQFQTFALSLFKAHPLIGNGTGSFAYYYKKDQPTPSWGPLLREPHNQYLLFASEYGLLGLGLFAWVLIQLTKTSLKCEETKPLFFALLLPFLIGNLSDSLFFYSGTGYFFIAMMALCLGQKKLNTDNDPAYKDH